MILGRKVIAIIGSRKWKDRERFMRYAGRELVRHIYPDPKAAIYISGGCEGIDTWAKEAAKIQGVMFIEVSPGVDDGFHYFDRNEVVAYLADEILAFIPRNQYRSGTWNTIKHFREMGKKNYKVLDLDGEEWDRWKK
jgi:predicted Rossmann fold nucleotide-binding protein DprA/Smf involved in DNA uptake